jgi:chromosome segregation ATPase
MEPLLGIAEELERRDAAAAEEAARVEGLVRELEGLRGGAEAVAAFLAALPAAELTLAREAEAAEAALADATTALAEADAQRERARKDDERLAAERAAQRARDALREAELRVERGAAERTRLDAEAEHRRSEAAELEAHAAALARALGGLPRVAQAAALAPAPGLAGVLAWAEEARGALLLAGAGLAGERDRIAREATELVASVSGDPHALAGVVGLRDRLARELG